MNGTQRSFFSAKRNEGDVAPHGRGSPADSVENCRHLCMYWVEYVPLCVVLGEEIEPVLYVPLYVLLVAAAAASMYVLLIESVE